MKSYVFSFGIIGWVVLLTAMRKYFQFELFHPFVLIACVYPLLNLSYNQLQESSEDPKYENRENLNWLFDRIQNNSLYIATGVFALNGITHSTLGDRDYSRIVPFYALTVFFGVCINLMIFYSKTEESDVLLSKVKSISLTYGITCMSIGIFYTLVLLHRKKPINPLT